MFENRGVGDPRNNLLFGSWRDAELRDCFQEGVRSIRNIMVELHTNTAYRSCVRNI
jgi:hypothetical protein